MTTARCTRKLLVVIASLLMPVSVLSQTIFYTGKLFGYYRIERNEAAHLQPVTDFLHWSDTAKNGWLLGMGDNFGPEFGASIQLPSTNECVTVEKVRSEDLVSQPKALYKEDQRYATKPECDNVANFLMRAGYRAIVPGREDFIYSPYWLRKLSDGLRRESDDHQTAIQNTDYRLDMLAANARLIAGAGNKGGAFCPLLFASDPFGAGATQCSPTARLPTAFDWVNRLDKIMGNSTRAAIESALASDGPSKQATKDVRATVVKNQLLIMVDGWEGACSLTGVMKRSDIVALQDWEDVLRFLPQITTAAASKNLASGCNGKSDEQADLDTFWSETKTSISVISKTTNDEATFKSLLLSKTAAVSAQRQFFRNIDHEMRAGGYAIAGRGVDAVLIIGVIGKETMAAVSPLNLKICGGRSSFAPCTSETLSKASTVTVVDPVSTLLMTIRAARFVHGSKFGKVVVMAQMPAPEAEVLVAKVRMQLSGPATDELSGQYVNAILSEAQPDYQSPGLTLLNVAVEKMTPVFTPPAVNPSASATITVGSLVLGQPDGEYANSTPILGNIKPREQPITTISELRRLMPKSLDALAPCPSRSKPEISLRDCEYQTMLAVLETLQRAPAKAGKQNRLGRFLAENQADVVMLERRDFFLGDIPDGYGGGDADTQYCSLETDGDLNSCLLRVALDRVLWKGDYTERVAMTGADLGKVLDTSEAQAAGETDLRTTDITQQWLVTYGFTQGTLTNLTNLTTGGDPLWIPADPECKQPDQGKAKATYCVNGRPLVDEQLYWVVTSSGLAEDKVTYPQFGATPDLNRQETLEFVTETTEAAMLGVRGKHDAYKSNEDAIAWAGGEFQQQRLLHVDFNKLVLSFSNSHSLGPTDQVPTQLQGVSDSRAAVPHSQDADFEGTLRLTDDHFMFQSVAVGTLTSFVYERSIKGNLSGSPETVTYPQNNSTFGGFAQYTLKRNPGIRSRALPRELIVLTPHQFQTQVNNARLFLAYSAKDGSGQPISGQLAIALPLVQSFNDKLGYRHEWGSRPATSWNLDGGSYAEGGFEYSVQNNILSSITLANGATQLTCTASALTDIGSCFKAAKATFPIGPSTVVVGSPNSATLHTPGAYWDVHLSRKLDFGPLKSMKSPFTLVSDSLGDVFFGRPDTAVLPTQTNYAVSWSSSLNFPVWGNLTIAPTYNAFFYRPQLSGIHEQIRSFAISLRWYTGRDERVPLSRQLLLPGPSSVDQTKTSPKAK